MVLGVQTFWTMGFPMLVFLSLRTTALVSSSLLPSNVNDKDPHNVHYNIVTRDGYSVSLLLLCNIKL